MSTVSTRFPYKERRVGKITEIALTRLTSTPLSPTRSRAEACQPQPAICAAWHGCDHGAATGDEGSRKPGTRPISLYRKKRIKILLLSLIGTFRENRRANPHPLFTRAGAPRKESCPRLDMQQKPPVGFDMPQPYSRKGLRGWMSTMSMRFPYKERRVGKITEIGLTRLTSTPLTPTRSKAEACQSLLSLIHI